MISIKNDEAQTKHLGGGEVYKQSTLEYLGALLGKENIGRICDKFEGEW